MSPTKKRTTRHSAAAAAAVLPATAIKKAHHEAKKQKTVNVNQMFHHAKAQRQRKQHEHCDVLAPKLAGIMKSPVGGVFKPFRTSRMKNSSAQLFDPNYFTDRRQPKEASPEMPVEGFVKLTTKYLEAQNENLLNVQKRHKISIAARRNGLLSSEDSEAAGERPWVPTEDDLEAVDAEIDELDKPLEDDIINVPWRQPNGAVTVKVEHLGDIIDKLTQRIDQRNVQLNELEREHRKVVKEIEVVKADVQGGNDETMRASEKMEAQMQALQDEIEQVEQSTKAELDKLQKEERAVSKKLNDTLKELMDNFS